MITCLIRRLKCYFSRFNDMTKSWEKDCMTFAVRHRRFSSLIFIYRKLVLYLDWRKYFAIKSFKYLQYFNALIYVTNKSVIMMLIIKYQKGIIVFAKMYKNKSPWVLILLHTCNNSFGANIFQHSIDQVWNIIFMKQHEIIFE